MSALQPVLELDNLSKRFTLHERGQELQATANANLQVLPGRLTALIGPSGAGKSSLLKCIYRTYLPSSGSIWYRTANDERIDLAQLNEAAMVKLRQREISFVTQFFQCVPRQSALDVVAQPLYRSGVEREVGQAAARAMLERVGLPQRLWALPPATFSGGEKQRVNLARELVRLPRLLLLDEPTASLDPASVQRVVRLLTELKASGVAMLAIFHDSTLVSLLADQQVTLQPV
jgi:alpha-D-ribose 1-methylphosphonate 5-triphosphate synthase subunit PhnL